MQLTLNTVSAQKSILTRTSFTHETNTARHTFMHKHTHTCNIQIRKWFNLVEHNAKLILWLAVKEALSSVLVITRNQHRLRMIRNSNRREQLSSVRRRPHCFDKYASWCGILNFSLHVFLRFPRKYCNVSFFYFCENTPDFFNRWKFWGCLDFILSL